MLKNIIKNKNEFFKFLFIGLLNAVIDFSILNILIFAFGLGKTSINYIIFEFFAFLVACTHSFFWNKNWVFKKQQSSQSAKIELSLFYLIAGTGLLFNVLIATIFFSTLQNYLSKIIAANLGDIIGSISVAIWDFLGYKFIVFKK